MPRRFYIMESAKGPGSMEALLQRMEQNLGRKTLQKDVRNAWKHIKKGTLADYKSIPVPVKAKKYPASHPYVKKYNRRRGTLRRSVRFFLSKPRKAALFPRAYMKIAAGYPYSALIHGTKVRDYSGANRGRIPDRFREEKFYRSMAPRRLEQAAGYLLALPHIRDPFK